MIDLIIQIVEPVGKAILGTVRRYNTMKEVRKPKAASIQFYTTGEK